MRRPFASVIALLAASAALSSTAAELTRGPYLQSCTATSIVVRWRTDVATDSLVSIAATNHPPREFYQGDVTTEHAVLVTGLTPATTYFYGIGTLAHRLASGAEYYFRTSATNAQPLRVWAIGDFGIGSSNQFAVRDAYMSFTSSNATDVWLMLGDNVYEQGQDAEFQAYLFNAYAEMLRHTVFWPAMGNHDAPFGSPAEFLNIFTLPAEGEAGGVPSHTELYYSFDSANVHFVCVDSWLSDRSTSGAMLNWLRADLSATTQDWIIVYWHHPPYSMGTDFSDSTPIMIQMRENVAPILESYGVDVVLTGHSHVYERSFLLNGHYGYSWTFAPANALDAGLGREDTGGAYRKRKTRVANSGTVYIVCGNSGQGGPVSFPQHPAMAVKADGYGSVVLDINGPWLNAKYLRPGGAIDDYFTIDKSEIINVTPRLDVIRTGDIATILWKTNTATFQLESAAGLSGADWQFVTNAVSTTNGYHAVTIDFGGGQRFFRLRSGD
jgi:acid phosphatase type 7